MGADFKHTLKDVEEKLGAKTAIVTYPIGAENTFKGVVMLARRAVRHLVRRRNWCQIRGRGDSS